LTALRDEIKAGNLSVAQSKRFGRFNNFFIADNKWREIRESFFRRAGLPDNADDVALFLTKRLNAAFDQFLARLADNAFISRGSDSNGTISYAKLILIPVGLSNPSFLKSFAVFS
jgi:hypothetical protein